MSHFAGTEQSNDGRGVSSDGFGNRQRWCGRDVARQIVPGAGSGDRKSSVDSRVRRTGSDVVSADRRRVLIPRSAGWRSLAGGTSNPTHWLTALLPKWPAVCTVLFSKKIYSSCIISNGLSRHEIMGPKEQKCLQLTAELSRQNLHCSWTSRLELSVDGPQTAGLVYSCFRQALKTFFFGRWHHSAVT